MSTRKQAEFTERKRKVGEPMVLPGTVVGGNLGIFYTDFTLWNPEMTDSRTLSALVDTGASYVQVPAPILDELGIRRVRSRTFTLADGSKRELSMGLAPIELEDDTAEVYVIFGDEGRSILLGAFALEVFALAVDAKNRRFIPADLPL